MALPVLPPRQLRCRRLGSDWPLSPLSVDTGPYQDQFRAAAVCRRRLHGPHPAVRADDSHTPWRGNVSAMLPAKVGLAVDRYLKTWIRPYLGGSTVSTWSVQSRWVTFSPVGATSTLSRS